jgi:chemotaxis protein CheZ
LDFRCGVVRYILLSMDRRRMRAFPFPARSSRARHASLHDGHPVAQFIVGGLRQMTTDIPAHDDNTPVTAAQLLALAERLEAMHSFTIERIKEVRADVAGSVELHDMSSNEVLGKIGDLLSQVTARSSIDDVGGPGEEIEAVIRLNAEAANRIMDAAEHISERIDSDGVPAEVRFAILEQVTAIFEACGFQDLTGQRIQRALKTLRSIEETMLGRKTGESGPSDKIDQAFADHVMSEKETPPAQDFGQDDIDALFR